VTVAAGNQRAEARVQHHYLDNGLHLLLEPIDTAPVVGVQAWVGVGSADERPSQAGIAHVFEHMLFKGTDRRGVGDIAREVESAGGEINAWTSFNETVYHVTLPSGYVDDAIDVLGDALQSSSFDPGELDREREVILEEIRQSLDDPHRTVAQALFSTAYERHPYGRPVIGSADVVRRLRRRDMLGFYDRWYVANNITLVVAGNFEPDRVVRSVEQHFGAMSSGAVKRRNHREPPQTEPRLALRTHDVSEASVALGFHIPSLRSPDTPALDVAAIALGQGESSRLTRQLRRERELVTSIYSYAHTLRDRGLFLVNAGVRVDDLRDAVAAVAEQTMELANHPLDQAELEKAIHAIEADAIYSRETAEGLARKYGYYQLAADDAEFESEYIDRVRRITLADVQAAAARHLRHDNATLAVVVPRAQKTGAAQRRRLASALRAGARAAQRSTKKVAGGTKSSALVRKTLANGLRLVVKRDPAVPIVAMRAVWPGGLRRESTRTNGINYLLSSVIARGCGSRDAEQLAAMIDAMAGSLSAMAGRNSFGVRGEFLSKNWDRGLELIADCILRPRFDDNEISREKRRILEQIVLRQDNPSYVAFRAFVETLYRKHPYRLDLMGTKATVSGFTRKRLKDYYRRNYPVGALTLAIVGDVDPDKVIARVEQLFGSAPKRAQPARKVPTETFSGRSVASRNVFRFLDRQQAHVLVGFPGTKMSDKRRYALEVLTTILGGQGGRLFVELRDRQSLAYRVGAFSLEGLDPGYFAVYLACSPDKLATAVASIRRELERLATEPPSKKEVARAVKYLVGTHQISLQRRASVAAATAFHEAYGLGYDHYEKYAAHIRAVTPVKVRNIAKAFIDWDKAIIATVKPPDLTPAAARRAKGARKRPVRRKRAPKSPRSRRR
jgi:zinc protease